MLFENSCYFGGVLLFTNNASEIDWNLLLFRTGRISSPGVVENNGFWFPKTSGLFEVYKSLCGIIGMSVKEKETGIDYGVAVGFCGFETVSSLLNLLDVYG